VRLAVTEVSRPDYLSMVNKNGSGFDISGLVTSIVAAEIEPKRSLEKSKLEKTENAISGIGYLNSQATITNNNFDTITKANFFETTSTSLSVAELRASDETKIQEVTNVLSNVTIAKNMVFEFDGFTSLTTTFSADITVNFGSWSESGGTYSFTGNGNTKNLDSFSGKTLEQVAGILNGIDGISAKVINSNGSNDDYSLIVSGDSTGNSNGFQIIDDLAGSDGRWETPSNPATDGYTNQFSQLAADASFTVDGISYTRPSNTINDVIPGVLLNLKSDSAGSTLLTASRSKSAIEQTLRDTIFSLNEFKNEIDRLTEINVDSENGPLATDVSAKLLKTKFKSLAIAPINGFGDNPIYLSQLGIKSNTDGSFYLDEAMFAKTLKNNPNYFSVLKDENISASSSTAKVTKSQFTNVDPGIYTVEFTAGQWKFGSEINLTQSNKDNGGSSFTSTAIPGLEIETLERTPSNFNVYIGKSFAQKVKEFMQEITGLNSTISSSKAAYEKLGTDIQDRLEKIEQRETLLKDRYTQQFGTMENSMAQFNSTKSLLENLVSSWNQK
jgi:flagellar hook-associated protein 2